MLFFTTKKQESLKGNTEERGLTIFMEFASLAYGNPKYYQQIEANESTRDILVCLRGV